MNTDNEIDSCKFVKRLLFLMTSNNLSREKAAKAIGVTRQALNNWVNGQSIPNIISASRIAKHFNVSLDYLVGNSDSMTVNNTQIGIDDVALYKLKELYKNDDEYGDLTELLNAIIVKLDRKLLHEINESEVISEYVYKILDIKTE